MMKRLFALGFEGTQSAAEWLCPVRALCSFPFVLVPPFWWLLHMFVFFLDVAQGFHVFYSFWMLACELWIGFTDV